MFVQNLFPYFFSKGLLPIFVKKKKKKSTLLLNSQESPGQQEDETSQF